MYRFIIPLFALAFLLVSCGPKQPSAPVPTGAASSSLSADMLKFDGKILTGKHTVVLHTSKGDVTLELDADVAPKTVTNFVTLARNGYFDNLTFHRVIPDFMIQGGDPSGNGTGGQSIFGPTFADEINAKSYGLDKTTVGENAEGMPLPEETKKKTLEQYFTDMGYTFDAKLKSLPLVRGAICMANRGPNTNGSQFFIIQAKSTPWLHGKHTVFGMVTKGMDVVDAIAKVERNTSDQPLVPVTFTAEVVGEAAASSAAVSSAKK